MSIIRCDTLRKQLRKHRDSIPKKNTFKDTFITMNMTKSMHRMTAWIAFCAILLASLAPSISHAVAAAKGTPNGWMEICTVEGAKLVQVDGGKPSTPSSGDKSLHFEHCPFCLNHAVAAGMPPADFVLPVVAGTSVVPLLFYQASHPLFAWTAAQPRAPPVLS